MRAWNHAEGTVILAAIIQMNTDREHSLQNGNLRAHMNDIGFARPRSPTFDMDFLPNGNHTVLMPRHLPVRSSTFVEKDSSHREALVSQHRFDRPPHLIRTRDTPPARAPDHITTPLP